ncbi:MAG: phosphate acyltransferase PlsX [Planctomycetota bacterium]
MRIGVDVMGGDHAPGAILDGCVEAIQHLGEGDSIVLIGDEAKIKPALQAAGLAGDPRFEVVATTQVIEMGDAPVTALRNKQDSSIVRWGWLGGKRAGDQRCDIIISAGNTGACVASAQMSMRRLPGVHRPGIAVTLPTFHGPVVICDVGANPEPRPSHLHQYALMAAVYAERVIGVPEPTVGLLSIGGEEGKGNAMAKETHALLKSDPTVRYEGLVEGRELFTGKVRVLVTEGFTGNVVLKLAEGLSAGIFQTIAREVAESDPEFAPRLGPVVKSIYKKHDYHEYGGAPLLGANGVCLICHGSSESRTIANAVRAARDYMLKGVNDGIVQAIERSEAALGAAPAGAAEASA